MRIHGEPLWLRCCTGDQLRQYFLTRLMFYRAGLKLFRTSLRGLLWCLEPRSMISCHNTGSKSDKIVDKIVIFHGFWVVPYFLFFIANLILTKTSSQYWSLASFAIWQMTYSHRTLKKIHRKLGANLWGILMLCILSTYPSGLSLSDGTECLWVSVPTTDHAWVHVNTFEQVLNMIEPDWMQLNMIEHARVRMNAFEWALNVIKCDWMWLNALEYTWTPLRGLECDWMNFTTYS